MMQMLDNRVLIEPYQNPELERGIYTGRAKTDFSAGYGRPGETVEQITMGRVVSVGPGKRHKRTGNRIPTGLEVGDWVCFSDSCHRPAGVQDFIVIRSDDVMLVSDEPIERCEILN